MQLWPVQNCWHNGNKANTKKSSYSLKVVELAEAAERVQGNASLIRPKQVKRYQNECRVIVLPSIEQARNFLSYHIYIQHYHIEIK